MNCSRARDLIPDLAAGSLDPTLEAELRAHVAACPACAEDLSTLTQTLNALDAMPTPKPSNRLRSSVYAAIEAEKRSVAATASAVRPRSTRRSLLFWIFQPVAACLLIAVGFVVGSRRTAAPVPVAVAPEVATTAKADPTTEKQIADLQAKVDSMTQIMGYSIAKNSTNDRLAKVLTTAATLKPGEQVIDNLITTMTLDPSANVRLNAVEALYAHASDQVVRAAAVASLTHEASPLVQIALIDFLVGAHDHEAVPELQKLVASEQTDPNVRDAAKNAIDQL